MAEFVLEVLDAADAVDAVEVVEAIALSEAWWTRMNMSLSATPTYEVAFEGANDVVTIDCGVVAVIVSRPPVIVCPPMVHIPYTVPTSPSGTVSGPLFIRLKPEREVAACMMFTCEDFKTET
jgi:hypothetical protein